MSDDFIDKFPGHVQAALKLARKAANTGTFGVGAVLVDENGRVIAADRNRMWSTPTHSNATAHAEMGVMRSYYEQRAAGETLPPPEKCTIISTLDPCVMCAGAVMLGQFKQISLAIDPHAGVNRYGSGNFITLPIPLRETAERSFVLAGVNGERNFNGRATGVPPVSISAELADAAFDIFYRGARKLNQKLGRQREWGIRQEQDLEVMPQGIWQRLQAIDRNSLSIVTAPENPSGEVLYRLQGLAKQAKRDGHTEDAAALIHPSGHVLLALGSQDREIPLDTAIMRLTRAYEQVRGDSGIEGFNWLPSRRDCTIVTFRGFDVSPASVMEIGALRSASYHIQPRAPQHEVTAMIETLPNTYRIGENSYPKQVSNPPMGSSCLQPNCSHTTRTGMFTRLLNQPSAS